MNARRVSPTSPDISRSSGESTPSVCEISKTQAFRKPTKTRVFCLVMSFSASSSFPAARRGAGTCELLGSLAAPQK